MQKRILYAMLAISAAIVITFGITPRVIGNSVREATISGVLELIPPETRGQLDINESQFDSGWFRSEAQIDVGYRPLGVSESLTMRLDFDIVHGPLLITPDGLKFGLAYAQISPSFNSRELTEALTEVPFDLPDVRFELLAGFDRSLTLGLDISAVNYSDAQTDVVFEGLRGSLVANSDQSAEFLLSMGKLQAEQAESQFGFTMAGLELESFTEQMNDLLAPSSALLAIPAISSVGPFPFNVTDISADSRVQTSTAGEEQIDVYQQLRIATIESEFPLASLSWTSEINEIHSDLIRSYYQLAADLQSQMNASQGTVNTQVTELGQEIALVAIQNSLVFNNLLSANAYQGDHSIDLRINWQGLPQLDNVANLDMNEALAALDVELDVSLDLEAIMRSPAAELIDPYVQQGYIVIDNGRVLLNGFLRDGELTLNGESVPLDQFF
jgi:uncharacterized protein YdgA (DUF945 family)